jgi:hypothetical protein
MFDSWPSLIVWNGCSDPGFRPRQVYQRVSPNESAQQLACLDLGIVAPMEKPEHTAEQDGYTCRPGALTLGARLALERYLGVAKLHMHEPGGHLAAPPKPARVDRCQHLAKRKRPDRDDRSTVDYHGFVDP